MKKIYKSFIFALILGTSLPLFAKTLTFNQTEYSGSVTYNDNVQPGDAVFVRLNIKYSKELKNKKNGETKAALKLYCNDKQIGSCKFFPINPVKERSEKTEFLCGIPLSTWLKVSDTYNLKVIFDTTVTPKKEMIIPLSLKERNFISEVIDLDKANTSIKTDISPERLNQIEKINKLFGTSNSENVFTLSRFIKPVKSDRLTAYFGDRRTYRYVNNETSSSMHYGNDYGVPEGTNVMACGAGKVVMAENRISTGWSVVIEHQPGLYSAYYHMSKLNVNEGQTVKAGTVIGLSGSTGLATGPHLHWEIRLNSQAVRPEFFTEDFTFNEGELN